LPYIGGFNLKIMNATKVRIEMDACSGLLIFGSPQFQARSVSAESVAEADDFRAPLGNLLNRHGVG